MAKHIAAFILNILSDVGRLIGSALGNIVVSLVDYPKALLAAILLIVATPFLLLWYLCKYLHRKWRQTCVSS